MVIRRSHLQAATKRTAVVAGITALSIVVFAHVAAQSNAPAHEPRCESSAAPASFDNLKVVKECWGISPDGETEQLYRTSVEGGVGQTIQVLVKGLDRFILETNAADKPKSAESPNTATATDPKTAAASIQPARPLDLSQLVLFIDGRPIKDLDPVLPGRGFTHVSFRLRVTEANRASWRALLAGGIAKKPESISVGFEGRPALETEVRTFLLRPVRTLPWLIWLAVCSALGLVILVAARTSNILRVPGPEPPALGQGAAGPRKAYSLGRTQLALWFVVVFAAYLFIWIVLEQPETLTATVLGLIGLSAATALGGATIDANQAALAGAAGNSTAATEGFLTDLVMDDGGISLARLQAFAWTLLLIAIFAVSVARSLSMPEFDATLLGLMGISQGTFIGFKGLEKK